MSRPNGLAKRRSAWGSIRTPSQTTVSGWDDRITHVTARFGYEDEANVRQLLR
jgi:hypothetical protein